jgi:hypothetical protein
MSYDYAAQGYEDPILIWEGSWNKRNIKLYIWRKMDPHQHGIWKYALDVRNKYNETLGLHKDELNHLMAGADHLLMTDSHCCLEKTNE